MADRPSLGPLVAKADILEHEARADRIRQRQRIAWRDDAGLDIQKGEQVVEIERLPRDLRKAKQQPVKQALEPEEGADQEGHVTEAELAGHGAPSDGGIGQVVRDGSERSEQAAPESAAGGEAAIVAKHGFGKTPELVDQEPAEA